MCQKRDTLNNCACKTFGEKDFVHELTNQIGERDRFYQKTNVWVEIMGTWTTVARTPTRKSLKLNSIAITPTDLYKHHVAELSMSWILGGQVLTTERES